MIPWYFVVLIIISIIVALVVMFTDDTEKNSAGFWGVVSGLMIGSLLIGHFMVRTSGGKPISEFHNNDCYRVVSFSTIADDPFRVIIGLRKVDDGRSGYLTQKNNDQTLRMYRIGADTELAVNLKSGQLKLPIYINTRLTNDTPAPVFSIQ